MLVRATIDAFDIVAFIVFAVPYEEIHENVFVLSIEHQIRLAMVRVGNEDLNTLQTSIDSRAK